MTKQQKIKEESAKMKKMIIDVDYFKKGDYAHWQEKEHADMDYEEWVETILIPDLEQYQSIEVYEDGTIYGYKRNTSHTLDEDNFGDSPELFYQIAEEEGYDIIED